MIVCHCKAVRESSIRAAVRAGAHCQRSVATACKAGGKCGGCRPAIEQIIEQEAPPPTTLFGHCDELGATG